MRQRKLRAKRAYHIKHATGAGGRTDTLRTNAKGPARTTPKHGKVNRIPYRAEQRNAMLGIRGKR